MAEKREENAEQNREDEKSFKERDGVCLLRDYTWLLYATKILI